MTVFEYASVLVSIVVGLALARILRVVGDLLGAKQRSADAWIVFGWCFILGITLVGWWMVGWMGFSGVEEIGFPELLSWTFATSLLYLSAHLLTPVAGPATSAPIETPPAAFFGTLTLHFGYVSAWTVLRGPDGMPAVPFVLAITAAAGLFLRTRRSQVIHLVAFVAVQIGLLLVAMQSIG